MARTYVITGSASGLGAATKAWIERNGHVVIGVDLRDADVIADLSTRDGRDAMVVGTRDACGGSLDAVISCAGVGVGGGTGESGRIVRVNYFGAVATLDGLRPLLARGTDPRAAAVTSIAALGPEREDAVVAACLTGDEAAAVSLAERGAQAGPAYGASKRAIARWVRRMAPTAEWAGTGIALNAVGPGVIDTPMTQHLLTKERRAETAERRPMPLHGVGAPEHIASLLAWLTSPENVLVTGQVVFADGGFEALSRGDDIW